MHRTIDYLNEKNDSIKHTQEKLNSFHLKITELATHFMTDVSNGSGHSQYQWATNQLTNIASSMKDEVSRVESMTETQTHNNYYSSGGGSASLFPYRGIQHTRPTKRTDQMGNGVETPNGGRRPNYGGRGRGMQAKRSSVISVSSQTTDYENTYRLYDFQKNTLANAITQLDNIVSNTRNVGK